MKDRLRVARFTLVSVGFGSELRPMRVRMAALASGRRELVLCVRSSRFVTGSALGGLVFSFQPERALLVVFQGVKRRLEVLFVMAGCTVAASDARRELALMNIFVAVGTKCVRNRFAEIAAGVALKTGHVGVFAQQRKLGSIVIEARVRFKRLPSRRHMAIGAASGEGSVLKGPFVRIGVAVVATCITQLAIVRERLTGGRLMASRTTGGRMFPRKRVNRLVVVEQLRRLPYILRMAGCAFRAKLALVRILMTLRTFTCHPQERLILVLHPDFRGLHFDAGRVVAALALQRGMFSDQFKSSHLAVVECLLVELGQLEALAVVLIVAAGAVQLIVGRFVDARMITTARVQSAGDFGVAIQAFERPLPDAESMATGALRGPFQIGVGLRQRTRRNLGR